jgi:acetyl esterase
MTIVHQISAHLAGLLGHIPPSIARALPVGPPREVDGNVLDPHVAILVGMSKVVMGRNVWSSPISAARRDFTRSTTLVEEQKSERVLEEDLAMPGDTGDLPARIYRPRDLERAAPSVVYLHGGGFVLGGLRSHDGVCRGIASGVGCVVISIDYRLAPEHPFPAAPDDVLAAWRWVTRHADELGIDPDRIAIGGDSAGANLATVLCRDARLSGVRPPRAQMLLYPATDMRRTARSHQMFSDGYLLARQQIEFFVESYLPGGGAALDDPRASPLRAPDLAGLPPALVVTAGFDPLRDEGDAYAKRLEAAGVRTAHVCHRSLVHGFASFARVVPAARVAMEGAHAWLAQELRGVACGDRAA